MELIVINVKKPPYLILVLTEVENRLALVRLPRNILRKMLTVSFVVSVSRKKKENKPNRKKDMKKNCRTKV